MLRCGSLVPRGSLRLGLGPCRRAPALCRAAALVQSKASAGGSVQLLRSCASQAEADDGSGALRVFGAGGLVTGSRAKPLDFREELVLYQSGVDVADVAAEATSQCRVGAGFAGLGFLAFLASVAQTGVPVPALAVFLVGGVGNCYALAVVSQRVIRNLTARHVDKLVVLPTLRAPEAASAGDPGEVRGAGGDAGGSSLGLAAVAAGAATMEERLVATPEVRLELITGGARRWLSLVDRLVDEDMEDERASFGEICQRLHLVHVNQEEGICRDPALLEALLRSAKVASDERCEPRELDQGGVEGAPLGPMLSEVLLSDVDDAPSVKGAHEPPADAMMKLGARVRNGGMCALLVGMIFAAGESARDRDGVARWTNLKLPGLD